MPELISESDYLEFDYESIQEINNEFIVDKLDYFLEKIDQIYERLIKLFIKLTISVINVIITFNKCYYNRKKIISCILY